MKNGHRSKWRFIHTDIVTSLNGVAIRLNIMNQPTYFVAMATHNPQLAVSSATTRTLPSVSCMGLVPFAVRHIGGRVQRCPHAAATRMAASHATSKGPGPRILFTPV